MWLKVLSLPDQTYKGFFLDRSLAKNIDASNHMSSDLNP